MNVLRTTIRDADASTLLGVYLADHLAGAVAGIELAERALQNNRGTPFEDFLRQLVREIREDRASLERLMDHLGQPQSPVKNVGAMVLERAGRLKLNGQLLGYSPLSRLVELEGLSAGVEAKERLWQSLRAAVPEDRLPPDVDLEELIRRADDQQGRLEEQRRHAAEIAFAGI